MQEKGEPRLGPGCGFYVGANGGYDAFTESRGSWLSGGGFVLAAWLFAQTLHLFEEQALGLVLSIAKKPHIFTHCLRIGDFFGVQGGMA